MGRAVFINYRGEDSHGYGALLYTELARQFGPDRVFLDAESIPAGADFVEELVGRVRSARVLLAVIGPRWLTATDPVGRRRIDDPDDWIRRELAEAFAAGVRVIPVLTDQAELPRAAELPADIAAVSRCQYRHLRRREPTADLARIVNDLTGLDPSLAAGDRGGRGRRSPVGPVVLATLGLLVLLAGSNLVADALPDGWRPYMWLVWPVGLLLAVPMIYSVVRGRLRPRADPRRVAVDEREQLDRAARELAAAVHAQWTSEAGLRLLRSPEPIRVRWSSVDRPVAADLGRVLVAGGIGGQPVRVRGEIRQIVAVFGRVATRQLVILGAPASGKSVAALLLTLGLLPDEPVPVLLSVTSWNPGREDLHSWVARRIVEEYPALANQDSYGPDAAARLIARKRIVPMLDGLDEMADALRSAAIAALDRAITDQYPLVVTCRSVEYRRAVNANGRILAHAAVVEVQPVDIVDAADFLCAADPCPERWRVLIDHVRTCPDGPLADTLRSPLMIDLARTVYAGAEANPGELLDAGRFADQRRLEHHLLEAFLRVAYGAGRTPPGSQPGSALARYPHDRARVWLRFLADHVTGEGHGDLAWWRLEHAVPRVARGVSGGLVVGLMFGLAERWIVGLGYGLAYALTFGLAAGCAFAFGRTHQPSRIEIRFRGHGRPLLLRCAASLVLGLGIGITPMGGPGGGLMIAIGAAVVLALQMWLDVPSDVTSAASPASVLKQDRGATLSLGAMLVLVLGPLPNLAIGQTANPAAHATWFVAAVLGSAVCAAIGAVLGGFLYQRPGVVAFGIAGALTGWLRYVSGYNALTDMAALVEGFGFALSIGIMSIGSRAWGAFAVHRVYLALRGQLPLRLMRFLDDAHRRGVLRQSGTVYQFRHEHLQNHIITRPEPPD